MTTGISGDREILRRLGEIGPDTQNAIEEALVKSALFVERDAKINSPVEFAA